MKIEPTLNGSIGTLSNGIKLRMSANCFPRYRRSKLIGYDPGCYTATLDLVLPEDTGAEYCPTLLRMYKGSTPATAIVSVLRALGISEHAAEDNAKLIMAELKGHITDAISAAHEFNANR